MKQINAQQISFGEIGGAGEIVYRVPRFIGYFEETDHQGKLVVKPMIDPFGKPTLDYDYKLTGQDLLYSICNLYRIMNNSDVSMNNGDAVCYWCNRNIQPYNIKSLTEYMDNCDDWILNYEIIQNQAAFYTDEFVRELCNLGQTMEYYMALRDAFYEGNPKNARELYYEGRLCDGYPFFERYSRIEDDTKYIQAIRNDYRELAQILIGLFPEFKVGLQFENKTDKIGMYADIDSVFDICWYTFSRLVADIAPPLDEDLDSLYSNGSYICCLNCGRYVKRKGPRQKYCSDPECQAARNRQKYKNFYKRNKQK